jgi:hypothetical protein
MSNTSSDVQVRLSVIGGSESSSVLKNVQGSLQSLQQTLGVADDGTRRLSATIRGVTTDGDKWSVSMRQMAESAKSTKAATDDLDGSLGALSGVMGAVTGTFAGAMAVFVPVAGVLYEIGKALVNVTESGIEFNSFLEKNKLGISALQLSFGQYVDDAGAAVNETRQWSAATADATNVQAMLMKQSLQSAASFQDVAQIYQMMSGAMIAGGAKSSQEMVQFAGITADMAAVMGTSYDRAARQMTLALLGVTRTTGQLGAMLRSMGVDNATLKSWRDQGIVVEELTTKLHAFLAMQPMLQNTWVGMTTNMKTAWQEFTGAVSQDTFDPLKAAMQELLHNVLNFSSGELSQAASQIARALGAGIAGAFDISLTTIKSALGVLTGALNDSGLGWLDVFKKFSLDVVSFFDIAGKAIFIMVETITHPLNTLELVVAKIIQGILSGVESVLRAIEVVGATGLGESVGIGPGVGALAGGLADKASQAQQAIGLRTGIDPMVVGLNAITDASTKATLAIMGIGPAWDRAFKQSTVDTLKTIQTAMASFGVDTSGVTELMSRIFGMKGGDTNKSDKGEIDTTKWDNAIQKYQEFVNGFKAKIDTAGLDGLDLALAKDQKEWQSNENSITNAQRALDDAAKAAGKSPAEFDKVFASLRQLNSEGTALKDSKAFEDYAQKFQDNLSKMNSIAMNDTAMDKVEKAWNDNLRKLNDDYKNALRDLGTAPVLGILDTDNPEALTNYNNYLSKKTEADAAYNAAVARNDAQLLLGQQKIIAEQTGNYRLYYDTLVQMDINAGKTRFQAEQDAAKKSADMLYAQADTMEKGYTAGFAKIAASIKSFGQDTADLMVSVWGDMTTAFDTGFYDVLTGKFSDLGNVLKSLWDSILKDFSQMLTKMLERWLVTGDAMGNGTGTGGILGGIFGGGSVAVTTPGGTSAMGPYNEGLWGGGGETGMANPNTGLVDAYGTPQGGTNYGGYAALAGGVLGIGYGLYTGVSSLLQKPQTYQPTYGGQDVPYSGNFGGQGGGAMLGAAAAVAAGTLVAAQAAVTVGLLTAAAASAATVVGLVVAAALLVVAAIMYIFSGPAEEHVKIAVAEAMSKSGAGTVIGGLVDQIIGQTTDFVGSLAARAGANVSQYTQAYQEAFQKAYGQATFDIHAGSQDDLQKDVNNFFQTVLPTLAMKAAFGQTGYGYGGDSGAVGGIAGTSWNTNNGLMDAQGNWIHQQLYDPSAPIPMMLTGLGFTAGKIGDIAQMLANGEDIKTFQTYLMNLVGVVVDLGDLAKEFGRTWTEWQTALTTAENQQGTAASFTSQITGVVNQGIGLDNMSAADQVTAAQALVTATQTILQNMAQALQAILDMINSINAQTATAITGYQNKLLTSAQIESNARNAEKDDMAAITAAANPTAVQAAWTKAMQDIGAVLDAIVARIQAIEALQQSYADFRTQMASDAGPQFATDPNAWLTTNQAAINAVTTTLATATGDAAIAGAKTLLSLVQERYNNELAMLNRVNSAIQSIDAQSKTSIDNLTMQAMGSVTTDSTGKQVWTPDVHAQGEYLNTQYNTLMGELSTATTPEEITSIMSQINGVISQLASQAQDPSHYAESRTILIQMQKDAQAAADKLLGTMKDTLTTDLKGIGDQLKAGEDALSTALAAAQTDFTTEIGKMTAASTLATDALNGMATDITTTMNGFSAYLAHWEFIMTNPSGAQDPLWNYGTNAPAGPNDHKVATGYTPPDTLWVDDPDNPGYQINTETGKTRKKPTTTGGYTPPTAKPHTTVAPTSGGFNVTVTVNSGTAEEIAAAAAAAVYPVVVSTVKSNNVELVRVLRNNPGLLA